MARCLFAAATVVVAGFAFAAEQAAIPLVPSPREMTVLGGECHLTADPQIEAVDGLPQEGYELSVTSDGVTIRHADPAGLFYAKRTLEQLRNDAVDGAVPCVEIKDAPAFRWRGVHLDEARHFFGKEAVKRILDEMSWYKFNVFHWHLTDHQAWILDVPEFPELIRDGKAYTSADVKEIVEYAAARQITVVPEIDFPGHFGAACRAYPELGCAAGAKVMCVGNPEAVKFAEKVLDSVCALFPSEAIHIGGDECPRKQWAKCPRCLELVEREGLKGVEDIQPWLTRHLAAYLAAKGRKAIGWEEIAVGRGKADANGESENSGPNESSLMPEKSTLVMGYHKEPAARAANMGYPVVSCPNWHCYFDYTQKLPNDPFRYFIPNKRWLPFDAVYRFDPYEGVEEASRGNIVGGQCCNWTEKTASLAELEWKLWPRGLALAEVLWRNPEPAKRDLAEFSARAAVQVDRLKARGVNCAPVPVDSAKTLNIVSYNIHHGAGADKKIDLKRIADVISGERPSVVALNEVDLSVPRSGGVDEAGEIARYLGLQSVFGEAIPYRGGSYGNAVLSREKPVSVERHPLPGKEPRVLLLCEFADFWFGTAHLDFGKFQLDAVEVIRRIVEEKAKAKPVFLAGDWNAEPQSETLAAMREFMTIISTEKERTYHAFRKNYKGAEYCIDYIAVDSSHAGLFRVEESHVIRNTRASDHNPVVVSVAPVADDGQTEAKKAGGSQLDEISELLKPLRTWALPYAAGVPYEAFVSRKIPPKSGPTGEGQAWTKLSVEEFFPFIDRYGQFMHKDWPDKVHSDDDFAVQREKEAKDLAAHPGPKGRDRWGGWADGPQLEKTGGFSTTKWNGKWWIVDPDGHLWWSHGPVRVSPSSATTPLAVPKSDRSHWFAELPARDDPVFGAFYESSDVLLWPYYGKRGIDKVYDFSAANLRRKYGEKWFETWADLAHRRLRSWGCNTIANGSDKRICLMDRTPYTERFEIHSRPIAGHKGGWWEFPDPFDPSFRAEAHRMTELNKAEIADPWCMGFFVDNEHKWGKSHTFGLSTLKSPSNQPCKVVFRDRLKAKYGTVENLNAAWGMDYADWDAFLVSTKEPKSLKGAMDDLEAFSSEIAENYFKTIREELKKANPGKLYLGCRFAGAPEFAVRAASKYCDVVSYNVYRKEMSQFKLPDGVDAPVLIGEFHFGALDRGPFCPGLILLRDQNHRAQTYKEYVRTSLEHPQIVGVHWHQFSDQATSGRFDGENMQVGWTDVCDTPYWETVEAVREMGDRMYEIRAGENSQVEEKKSANIETFDRNMAIAEVVTNGLKWIDGKLLPIEGRAFDDTECYYDRLPANVTTNVNGGVRSMKHHTAGMQFRFTTDSSKLVFKWVPYSERLAMDHMPSTGVSGIDVYRFDAERGRWLYVKTGRIKSAKGGSLKLDWTPGTPCLVNLPLYNGIKEFSLGLEPNAAVSPLGPRTSGVEKPVVFYGTSITHGGCASRPGMSFVNIIGRDLDVPIVNLGFSGSGVMEFEMSEHLARIDASCYVLDCVRNMGTETGERENVALGYLSGRNVEENYEPFIRNLRAKRPNVPIVMAEQGDVYLRPPNVKDRFVRALYEKLIAEGWENLIYLTKDVMFPHDLEGTVDGTHPNDWGMMALAKAYGSAVKKALGLTKQAKLER